MTLKKTINGFIAVLLFLPLIIARAETSTLLSEADLRSIDTYIETQIKQANIPGAALVVVEENQITYMRGYGVAGPNEQPVTAETLFLLGSVSKSFTALAIMQLVEAGKIELDAPVQKYLPWFRVANPEASRQMKVRHLLNHTSGLSTYAGRTHYASSDMSDKAIERRVHALCKAKLTAPVGKDTYYSNANYSTLGAIIESVSKRSYEDYIQEHIFNPLGMTNSYTSHEAAKQHHLATGYRYWFGRPIAATNIPYPRGDIAAMYLISSAKDMGRYLLAHMNGDMLEDERILSAEGMSKLHTPEKKNLSYAMGWWIGKVNGTPMISHGGRTPNYTVEIGMFPEHQKAYALLVNAQNSLSGPSPYSLCGSTGRHLIGGFIMPVPKAPRVHIALALLCVCLLGRAIGLAIDCRGIYRWWKSPDTRPKKKRCVVFIRGFGSCMVDIGIVMGMLWIVPLYHEINLSGLMLYAPDAGWLLLFNGALAIIGLMVSLGIMAFLFRQTKYINTITTEPVNPADS
jgi:CubicO group peptidase (beta-lactamase class C family)